MRRQHGRGIDHRVALASAASSFSAASTQVAGRPKVGSVVWRPGSFTCAPVGSMTMYWPGQTLPVPASTSLILMT